MRICRVERLPDNAVLAKNIYDTRGTFLYRKGAQISASIAKKLQQNGIFYVYIHDGLSEGIVIDATIDDEIKASLIFSFRDIAETKIKGQKKAILSGDDVDQVGDLVDDVLGELRGKKDISYMAVELMGTDMNTYSHSVNTSILSTIISLDLGLDPKYGRQIGLGAMLHDIGKTRIDNAIINKVAPFTDEEFQEIRRHSMYGYDMVRSSSAVDGVTKAIILNHHEKLDGSGYPKGIRSQEIPLHVRLVTMADMFDAMTSDRAYRRRMPIHEALENLMVECVNRIDRDIYMAMISKIVMYPPGSIVNLSEGSRGIITKYSFHAPTRPRVRILESHNFTPGIEIDLMEKLSILIDKVEI